jgi:hypothetical protein
MAVLKHGRFPVTVSLVEASLPCPRRDRQGARHQTTHTSRHVSVRAPRACGRKEVHGSAPLPGEVARRADAQHGGTVGVVISQKVCTMGQAADRPGVARGHPDPAGACRVSPDGLAWRITRRRPRSGLTLRGWLEQHRLEVARRRPAAVV